MTVEIHFDLDFRSGIPIYIQIMNQVKHMIASGGLIAGDQLPTVRQLAADLRVNFNTVARAYKILDEERIISTQHGRGTYILDTPSKEDVEKLRKQDLIRLTRHYLESVHKLGYSPAELQEILNIKFEYWNKNGYPPQPEDNG
ncbi:MAG: GntR family transcriptional regulator [Anaerolineaceae bacterium]|nr:GntR family transcriptional regulator [Anaerolineaceae bacterium]